MKEKLLILPLYLGTIHIYTTNGPNERVRIVYDDIDCIRGLNLGTQPTSMHRPGG